MLLGHSLYCSWTYVPLQSHSSIKKISFSFFLIDLKISKTREEVYMLQLLDLMIVLQSMDLVVNVMLLLLKSQLKLDLTLLLFSKRTWIISILLILETSLFLGLLLLMELLKLLELSVMINNLLSLSTLSLSLYPRKNHSFLSFFFFKKSNLNFSTVSRHGVMQVVYYTNNPNAPSAFYQCADFAIVH